MAENVKPNLNKKYLEQVEIERKLEQLKEMDNLEKEIGGLTNRLATENDDNQIVTVIIPDAYSKKPEKRPKT